jgi:phosphopantothenoylcysteine decarboxylase / phosphopantothenate---cysteine ligase
MQGKKILLGITGSIAAYKSAILARLLIKKGAEVRVVMTPLAKEFITPLTLATLTRNPVVCEFFNQENGNWNSHVDLGIWADLFVIAPATANTISKMANGIADNLLLTTYLSARCPVIIAPAMDLDMFQHPSLQKNISILKSYGNTFIEPSIGELASGLEGKGRMEEPEIIIQNIQGFLKNDQVFSNKRFLVTAGPTYEPIDPVRFIGNYSSGKMGFAIAEELASRGGMVTLVAGPTNLKPLNKNITLISVQTADEMYRTCLSIFEDINVGVLSAAVADYRPVEKSGTKIKKSKNPFILNLKETVDIASELGKIKKHKQLLIGFALETNDEIENAKKKLHNKNLDFIVLNSLNDQGAGFQFDTNKIKIIDKSNKVTDFNLKSKQEVATDIADFISKILI